MKQYETCIEEPLDKLTNPVNDTTEYNHDVQPSDDEYADQSYTVVGTVEGNNTDASVSDTDGAFSDTNFHTTTDEDQEEQVLPPTKLKKNNVWKKQYTLLALLAARRKGCLTKIQDERVKNVFNMLLVQLEFDAFPHYRSLQRTVIPFIETNCGP